MLLLQHWLKTSVALPGPCCGYIHFGLVKQSKTALDSGGPLEATACGSRRPECISVSSISLFSQRVFPGHDKQQSNKEKHFYFRLHWTLLAGKAAHSCAGG